MIPYRMLHVGTKSQDHKEEPQFPDDKNSKQDSMSLQKAL